MESPDKQMDAAPPAPPPLNDKVSEGANAQKQSLRREDSVDDMQVSIPRRMLECGICLDIIVEPLTISCGHSFCRMCLHACLTRSNKKCPVCRAICHTQPALQPVNSMLASLAKAAFPEECAEREAAAGAARAEWDHQIPLFFYNNPMVKGEQLALHLFEPR